jgi:hypothetical protein
MRPRSIVLVIGLGIGCTSGALGGTPHEACDIRDEDRRCTVDDDCVYLGTYLEGSECCYDPCGGGVAVNEHAIGRLERARAPLLEGSRGKFSRCRDRGDVKCTYGGVYCVEGLCEQRPEGFR